MPTFPLMQLPKTKSAEEFEAMCADVLADIYNMEFSFYGRKGQKQHGIDLVSSSGYIVAQCKNYYLTSYDKHHFTTFKNSTLVAESAFLGY